jgi:hypothetical protein
MYFLWLEPTGKTHMRLVTSREMHQAAGVRPLPPGRSDPH